jgi:hypothetical protein
MAFGGYYQARARPGLRVVSLNSNYMTDDNFWIWYVLFPASFFTLGADPSFSHALDSSSSCLALCARVLVFALSGTTKPMVSSS